tara:strand:+ start:2663 stop:3328 length:666 start_codon:yes stop_codon:yes gene_type:complete
LSNFLITGANRGIGFELSKQLYIKGENVIATCRNASEKLKNLGVNVIENVDISSGQSISLLKNKIKDIQLDCLIHNAGILEYNSFEELDPDSIKRQFDVNALSPLCMTRSLINLFSKNSKIAFITSRMASLDDNNSGGSYGYRMSKVALSMAAKSLSVDLYKKEIYIAIIHPGLVSTRMTGYTKEGISSENSAKGIIKRIDSLNRFNTGSFWHSNGDVLPW